MKINWGLNLDMGLCFGFEMDLGFESLICDLDTNFLQLVGLVLDGGCSN